MAAAMRVFVVDDDVDTTECLRLLLKVHGHEVAGANSGSTALEVAPGYKPDVMLVDLGTPEIDGLTLARRLRRLPDLLGMSLVAMTGYGDAPHREQALQAGFDECVTKPLPIKELLRLLARFGARARRHVRAFVARATPPSIGPQPRTLGNRPR